MRREGESRGGVQNLQGEVTHVVVFNFWAQRRGAGKLTSLMVAPIVRIAIGIETQYRPLFAC